MAAFASAPAPRPAPPTARDLEQLWQLGVDWLSTHFVQIAIAVAIGALLVALMLAARSVGERLCRRSATVNRWPETFGRVIARTQPWFMLLFAAQLVDRYAYPPAVVANIIDMFFIIAFALQGAIWARELILGVVESRVTDDDPSGLGSAIGIIRLLVTVVLFAIAIVLILDNLGVNVTGLVAGLGIGGIAIGLAAKGIFDDLFSALSIIFDRPFRRGDAIKWDDTSGTVEAIGLKTTRLRAVGGEEVVISNTNLLSKELHNLTRLERRRISFTLRLLYATPTEAIARVPDIVRGAIARQPHATLVRCGVAALGPVAIEMGAEIDIHSGAWDDVYAARHACAIAILAALEAAGIVFAGADGRAITPPSVPPPPGSVGAPPPAPES